VRQTHEDLLNAFLEVFFGAIVSPCYFKTRNQRCKAAIFHEAAVECRDHFAVLLMHIDSDIFIKKLDGDVVELLVNESERVEIGGL
jgi:hypothetical protein